MIVSLDKYYNTWIDLSNGTKYVTIRERIVYKKWCNKRYRCLLSILKECNIETYNETTNERYQIIRIKRNGKENKIYKIISKE